MSRGSSEWVTLLRGPRAHGRWAKLPGLSLVAALAVWGCQTTTVDQADGSGPPQLTQQPVGSINTGANTKAGATAAITPATTGSGTKVGATLSTVPSGGKSAPLERIGLLAPTPSAAPFQTGQTTLGQTRSDQTRIALLVPLSGRGAPIGRALLDAVQLALFEAARDDLELLIFDTQGTAAGAEDAARLAVQDGAGLILGPLFGASAEAARPVAVAAGISIVSFSNNQDIAGGGVYVFGFLPAQQVRRIIAFASRKGYGTLGALVPSTGFGELVLATASIAAEQVDVSIVQRTYYDPSETDLGPLIRQFADYDARKSALSAQKKLLSRRTDQISRSALGRLAGLETLGDPPYQAVLLPAGGAELRGIAPLLAFYDVDPARVRFLGTALWDGNRGLGVEPALLGGWFAAPPPDSRLLFEDKFERAFGRRPPRLASLGYDAMLLGVALTYGDGGPDFSDAALTDARGFAGVDGIVRLLTDGTNQRGLAVLEVRERGVRVIDPAPASFEAHGF